MKLIIILITIFLKYTESLIPSCTTCKFFIENSIKPELGLCKIFKEKVNNYRGKNVIYNLAIQCRNNEDLCGKKGTYYEKINNDKFKNYEYIKNLSIIDIVEETNLEELYKIEKDISETFRKMKKHNKK